MSSFYLFKALLLMYRYQIKKKKTRPRVEDTGHIIETGISLLSSQILPEGLIEKRGKRDMTSSKSIYDILPSWFKPIDELGPIEVKKVRVLFCSEFGTIEMRYEPFEEYIIATIESKKYIEQLIQLLALSGYSVDRMYNEENKKISNKLIIREHPVVRAEESTEDIGQYEGLEYLFSD